MHKHEHVTYNVYVDRFSIIVSHFWGGGGGGGEVGTRTSEIKPAGWRCLELLFTMLATVH